MAARLRLQITEASALRGARRGAGRLSFFPSIRLEPHGISLSGSPVSRAGFQGCRNLKSSLDVQASDSSTQIVGQVQKLSTVPSQDGEDRRQANVLLREASAHAPVMGEIRPQFPEKPREGFPDRPGRVGAGALEGLLAQGLHQCIQRLRHPASPVSFPAWRDHRDAFFARAFDFGRPLTLGRRGPTNVPETGSASPMSRSGLLESMSDLP